MLGKMKMFDEAAAVAGQALELWPDDLNAGVRKAHYLARAGDEDASMATLIEMTERHPNNASIHFRLARRLARKDRDSEAEAAKIPNAEYRPIESIWGHRAGNPIECDVDRAFLRDAVHELLAE